jgi:ankyrin repeat protein
MHKCLSCQWNSSTGGVIPSYQAARAGQAEAYRLLLEHHATVHATDDSGRTPLHQVESGSPIDVPDGFLTYRADVEANNSMNELL